MFYYIFHIGFSLDLELSNGEKIKHKALADKKKRASVNYTTTQMPSWFSPRSIINLVIL